MPQGLLIAAERSGAGKTMITAALARALIDRGLTVQCFKVGPDFIDPGYHTAVTGRISRNLDGWMMGRTSCLQTFHHAMGGADIGVVEGVMGLFDGLSGAGDEGSTAQIAKMLELPVILLIDGSSFARTAGAVVLGFEQFDPDMRIAGVIFNKVGSTAHYGMLKAGVQEKCTSEVLGYIPRNKQWHTPERHLGLVMASEHTVLKETIGQLAQKLEETVDVKKIIEISGQAHGSAPTVSFPTLRTPNTKLQTPRIGIARDEAFCFCYQDNLDMLKNFGAEPVFFSPLHDAHLPGDLQGLYLPGGYPELHGPALSRNASMRKSIAAFCAAGRPVYAECGGFLYLLESLTGVDGACHEMAGVFPAQARMLPRLQRLGYVEVAALPGHPFLGAGEKIRGHEFHYSAISGMPDNIERTCRVTRRKDRAEFAEGFRLHNTLAGYMHLHFASNQGFAKYFVSSCRQPRPS
jgi:cobyrinic acid a,c-diamide synthase